MPPPVCAEASAYMSTFDGGGDDAVGGARRLAVTAASLPLAAAAGTDVRRARTAETPTPAVVTRRRRCSGRRWRTVPPPPAPSSWPGVRREGAAPVAGARRLDRRRARGSCSASVAPGPLLVLVTVEARSTVVAAVIAVRGGRRVGLAEQDGPRRSRRSPAARRLRPRRTRRRRPHRRRAAGAGSGSPAPRRVVRGGSRAAEVVLEWAADMEGPHRSGAGEGPEIVGSSGLYRQRDGPTRPAAGRSRPPGRPGRRVGVASRIRTRGRRTVDRRPGTRPDVREAHHRMQTLRGRGPAPGPRARSRSSAHE